MILINFQVIYIIKQRDGWNFTDTRGIAKVEVFLMVRFLQSGLRPIPKWFVQKIDLKARTNGALCRTHGSP